MRSEHRKALTTWLYRIAAAGVLAGTLGYVPYHLYTHSGLGRMVELRRDLAALQAHNADLRDEVARLGQEAAALRDDLGAIERVARRDLGWVRPGEIVFQVEAASGQPSPGARGVER